MHPDETFSFRWDPQEDVRYALRFNDLTDTKTKERIQHGADHLAAFGLAAVTVAPQSRGGRVRLACRRGSAGRDGVYFAWPIWRAPACMDSIKAMLADSGLIENHPRFEIGEIRRTQRINQGHFMNWTRADPLNPPRLIGMRRANRNSPAKCTE